MGTTSALISLICICHHLCIVQCQEIKLCPESGPLHLPPAGCGLKKNYETDQDCFTISVVCKEVNLAGNTQPATYSNEEVITTAMSILSQNQSHRYCPFPNDTAEAIQGCQETLKPCNSNEQCSITQMCCEDKTCGRMVCKESLLPCPIDESTEDTSNSTCQVVLEPDKERNCLQSVLTCM